MLREQERPGPIPSGKWLFILFVSLMGAALLQRLIPLIGSDRRLLLQYYTEDAFYLHAVARHFAAGHGITIDGVRPTNGFQPLGLFLYAPFYLLSRGERMPALRMAYALELLMSMATAVFVYAIARRIAGASSRPGIQGRLSWGPFLAAALWFTPLRVIRNDMNGLEDGSVRLASLHFNLDIPTSPTNGGAATLVDPGLRFLARVDLPG